jgi:hypothetical protein
MRLGSTSNTAAYTVPFSASRVSALTVSFHPSMAALVGFQQTFIYFSIGHLPLLLFQAECAAYGTQVCVSGNLRSARAQAALQEFRSLKSR